MEKIIIENYLALTILVAVTTLLSIYLLIKRKQEPTQPIKQDQSQPQTNKLPEQEAPQAPKQPHKKPTPINRKKYEPAEHGKIKKEDFAYFSNKKVLIAEDNIINQKVLIGLLGESGVAITIANDGQETLEILKISSDFDLILMDAHMPHLDGLEATQIIRANKTYDHIPIIALSGDTSAADVRKMLNSGMDAHLEKPIKLDAMYDAFYSYIAHGNTPKAEYVGTEGEIDHKKGLELFNNDTGFYLEILKEFVEKYEDSADQIMEHLKNGNRIEANKILLDVSGISSNLGATHLHEITMELKENLTHPEDLDYVNSMKKYRRSLKKACESIHDFSF